MIKEEGINRQIVDKIVSKFNHSQREKIRLAFVLENSLKSQLIKAAVTGNGMPDVALVPSDYVGINELRLSAIPRGLLRPEISKENLQSVTVNHRIMGVPVIAGNHLTLWFNRKLVTKPASSFEEMLTQKSEIEKKGAKVLATKYHEMYWFVPFLAAFGGWPLGPNNEFTLDTGAMRSALVAYKKISETKLIDPNCDYRCVSEDFRNGKYAYAINGEWDLINATHALGEDFGVTELPSIDGRRLIPMFSTHALVFPKNALAKQGAVLKDFVRYMQSDDVQRIIFTEMSRIPVVETIYTQNMPTMDQNMRLSIQQLKYAKPMPNHQNMAYAWEGMQAGSYLYLSGKADESAASKYMQDLAVKVRTHQGVEHGK